MHPLAPRILEVARVEELSPLMRRVVLTGDRAGTVPYLPWAPADHVKIVLPDDDGDVRVPRIENGRAVWDGFAGVTRDYTIRTVDPVANELTIDGVLHDHGPAGRWFLHAAPGSKLGVLGPRGTHLYPPSFRHYVLIADETALPAVGRWLDQPGLSAHFTVITVAAIADAYPLAAPSPTATLDLRASVLDGEASRGEFFARELASALETSPAPTDVFVWAAGEAGTMKAVRQVLRDHEVPRYARDVDGYWRTGTSDLDHHSAEDD